jgi:hypothetical protein
MDRKIVGCEDECAGTVAGSCECGNELSASIKIGLFLNNLSNCQLLNNNYASGS